LGGECTFLHLGGVAGDTSLGVGSSGTIRAGGLHVDGLRKVHGDEVNSGEKGISIPQERTHGRTSSGENVVEPFPAAVCRRFVPYVVEMAVNVGSWQIGGQVGETVKCVSGLVEIYHEDYVSAFGFPFVDFLC
jgi:hypothetical protein